MTAIATADPPADDLLRRAQSGDHDAFAAIIEEYEAVVFGIALHFFTERDRAEEIAQDVFLQLYRNLGGLQSMAHVLFWLRQVSSRKCIDTLRRRGLRRVDLDTVELASSPAVSDPLIARRVRRVIAALPDIQRVILTLRYQEDLGPADIGQIMGMPVNTVKSCLHRALTTLRKEFGGDV